MVGFHVQSTKSSKALQMFQGNCVNYHRNSTEYLLNTFLTKNATKFVRKQLDLCKKSVNFSQTEDEDL